MRYVYCSKAVHNMPVYPGAREPCGVALTPIPDGIPLLHNWSLGCPYFVKDILPPLWNYEPFVSHSLSAPFMKAYEHLPSHGVTATSVGSCTNRSDNVLNLIILLSKQLLSGSRLERYKTYPYASIICCRYFAFRYRPNNLSSSLSCNNSML